MKIGLISTDKTVFPNLALMKISNHHKTKGDSVEWVNYWQEYDKVYVSKVFTFSPEPDCVVKCDHIEYGGTGYSLTNCLPDEIENTSPDYSIYPNAKYAIGFFTRGCSRGCPFCVVNEKEGRCHVVCDDVKRFWHGQKEIKLLDPNLLECPDSEMFMEQLVRTSALIDFTQGLDIRLMNDRTLDLMLKIRVKRVHFAYDMMRNSEIIERKLSWFMQKTAWNRNKVTVYILSNYDTTLDDDLHRIEFVKKIGATPYLMIYNKHSLPKGDNLLKLQRWCNAPQILFSTKWRDYNRGNQ